MWRFCVSLYNSKVVPRLSCQISILVIVKIHLHITTLSNNVVAITRHWRIIKAVCVGWGYALCHMSVYVLTILICTSEWAISSHRTLQQFSLKRVSITYFEQYLMSYFEQYSLTILCKSKILCVTHTIKPQITRKTMH